MGPYPALGIGSFYSVGRLGTPGKELRGTGNSTQQRRKVRTLRL